MRCENIDNRATSGMVSYFEGKNQAIIKLLVEEDYMRSLLKLAWGLQNK